MNEKHDNHKQILLEVYKAQWDDIHHSRNQDWELSKIILTGFVGLSGLKVFGPYPRLQLLLAIVFSLISVLAIGVTIRHKHLLKEKMNAIRKLESKLGLDELNLFPMKKWCRLFTTQNLLIAIYCMSTLIFLIFIFMELVSQSTK